MTEKNRGAAERAKREQRLKNIEKSHAHALEVIADSKREVERSRRLIKESDAAREDHDTDNDRA
jgi:hypothetical protein